MSLLENRIKAHGMDSFYEVLNTEIRGKNGTLFFFEGLWQNIDSIKSIEGVDICWVEEANTVSEQSWKKLIPTIRKTGSEIWSTFNPELKADPAYQRFILNTPSNAFTKKVSWRDNPWFTQEMKDEMEHLKSTDYDEYLHVWEGELKAMADGAVYRKQITAANKDNRIINIPVEPTCEVNTFWDLGKNDTTAIWFHQRVGAENRFIDYYENRLVDLDHYVRVIQSFDYLYGRHYLPHDVEFDMLGLGNKNRRQMLEDSGIKPIEVVPRINHINEGIEQTRKAFASSYFHKAETGPVKPHHLLTKGMESRALRMEQGMEALANYQYKFDELYDTYRQTPLHNWASNGADAFRQFGQGYAPNTGWAGQKKKESSRGRGRTNESRSYRV